MKPLPNETKPSKFASNIGNGASMFYYILAFVLGAIISGLIVYILKEQQLKELEIEAMQAVQAAYDRGLADAQQAEEPGLGEILNGVGSVATIIGLLG